jgi:hypothetical protein
VTGHQAQHLRRLIVMVEIDPVHHHEGLRASFQMMRQLPCDAAPNIDAVIARQPVHLPHRVPGHQAGAGVSACSIFAPKSDAATTTPSVA